MSIEEFAVAVDGWLDAARRVLDVLAFLAVVVAMFVGGPWPSRGAA